MTMIQIGRVAGALALCVGLAGCFDMTTEVTVTSETEGSAVVTQDMGKDIYAMIKSDDSGEWCSAEGSVKTENEDGSATCVISSQGAFADLKFDEGGAKPTFAVVSPGVVRVSVQTAGMMGESSAEAAEAMKEMFEGRALTIRFGQEELTVVPDEVSVGAGGQRTLRKIKTGHRRSKEHNDLAAAAFLLAAQRAFPDAVVELVHLADEASTPLGPGLGRKEIAARHDKLAGVLEKVRNGEFPTKASDFTCPKCPAFFICGPLPEGVLVKNF